MAARSIGSGTISFGLVTIPVKLYTAVSSKQVGFNLLHEICKGRVKQQLVCPSCPDTPVIERTDCVRGYEHTRDTYVVFTDDELKNLEAESSSRLELLEFVPAATVDLLYIESTYYLGPDRGGDRAYRLLSDALESEQRVAVGTFAKRGKDTVVLVRPYKGGLLLHEVYYADEVRAFAEVELGAATAPSKPNELELARQLIRQLDTTAFDPSKYSDAYAARVQEAVQKKLAGGTVVAPEVPKARVIDLLDALRQSVAGAEKKIAEAANDQARRARGPKKAVPRKPDGKKKRRGADAS